MSTVLGPGTTLSPLTPTVNALPWAHGSQEAGGRRTSSEMPPTGAQGQENVLERE